MWVECTLFVVMLTLYLHLLYHWKTNSELDWVDVRHQPPASAAATHALCDLRLPLVVPTPCSTAAVRAPLRCHILQAGVSYPYPTLSMQDTRSLFQADTQARFCTEGNHEGLDPRSPSVVFAPAGCCHESRDWIAGSAGASMAWRHELAHRTWISTLQGELIVYASPPTGTATSDVQADYHQWTFTATPAMEKQLQQRCVQFTVPAGCSFHMPAYWWYRVAFASGETCALVDRFYTWINCLSIAPHLALCWIQRQNTQFVFSTHASQKTISPEDILSHASPRFCHGHDAPTDSQSLAFPPHDALDPPAQVETQSAIPHEQEEDPASSS